MSTFRQRIMEKLAQDAYSPYQSRQGNPLARVFESMTRPQGLAPSKTKSRAKVDTSKLPAGATYYPDPANMRRKLVHSAKKVKPAEKGIPVASK